MVHKTLTNHDDQYVGSEDGDVILGRGGSDSIFGSGGDDEIHGGNGNDILRAGTGDDHLFGDAGNDLMTVYTGHEVLDGGSGIDIIDFYYATAGVNIDLGKTHTTYRIGSETDKVGYSNVEEVNGSNFDDKQTGDGKLNILRGQEGDDRLSGGGGDDFLFGGNGQDVMTGGSGSDSFMFGSIPDGDLHFDHVTDFDDKSDRIGFNAYYLDVHGTGKITHIHDFNELNLQKIDAAEFQAGSGHVAATNDVRIIYDSSNGILYYDSNGAKDGGLGEVADLGKGLHITADSVIIYGF